MTLPTSRTFGLRLFATSIHTVIGLALSHDLLVGAGGRWLPPLDPTGMSLLLGPTLFVTGASLIGSVLLSGNPRSYRNILAVLAVFLLAVGGCPWAYMHHIVGGQPGNEGAGMLSTILFFMAGMPGMGLAFVALALTANTCRAQEVRLQDRTKTPGT